MYKDDREEEISQSDAEPVMTMNIPVRNADDVAELVFAVVLISARNSLDGNSGIITNTPSRDEFMDVNDEEVSDEDGCLSRSMTIKAHRRIMTERIWINCTASEIASQLLYSDTGAPLLEERVKTVRKKAEIAS